MTLRICKNLERNVVHLSFMHLRLFNKQAPHINLMNFDSISKHLFFFSYPFVIFKSFQLLHSQIAAVSSYLRLSYSTPILNYIIYHDALFLLVFFLSLSLSLSFSLIKRMFLCHIYGIFRCVLCKNGITCSYTP